MRKPEDLGFVKGPALSTLIVTLDGNRMSLPEEYLTLLGCEPPEDTELGFKFLQADTNEEWEGQVVEFIGYEQNTVDSAVVSPPTNQGIKLLPIAADAGGNYLYLDLMSNPMRVVDVSYESGAISQVANSFGQFVNILYPMDE